MWIVKPRRDRSPQKLNRFRGGQCDWHAVRLGESGTRRGWSKQGLRHTGLGEVCCRCGRRHWRLLFYKIILAILERLEGQRVEGVVSKKSSEETNLDKFLVNLTGVVGVVRIGTYFEVMIDWQNLLINWMVGMRVKDDSYIFWCEWMVPFNEMEKIRGEKARVVL